METAEQMGAASLLVVSISLKFECGICRQTSSPASVGLACRSLLAINMAGFRVSSVNNMD